MNEALANLLFALRHPVLQVKYWIWKDYYEKRWFRAAWRAERKMFEEWAARDEEAKSGRAEAMFEGNPLVFLDEDMSDPEFRRGFRAGWREAKMADGVPILPEGVRYERISIVLPPRCDVCGEPALLFVQDTSEVAPRRFGKDRYLTFERVGDLHCFCLKHVRAAVRTELSQEERESLCPSI